MHLLPLLCAAALMTLPATKATAADRAAGRAFAEANCARCHATAATGPSPMREAPAFRDLPTRYPVDHLAEALAEGIATGHPGMPEFRLEPGEIHDFLAYLRALRP